MSVEACGRRIRVWGAVQGVGFRPWVARVARDAGLGGTVAHAGEGVVIEAFGSGAALDGLLERLRRPVPPAASVHDVAWEEIPPRAAADFAIGPQDARDASTRRAVPPDLPPCPRFAAELADAANRRAGDAFICYRDCGPRGLVERGQGLERDATSLAAFPPCPRCRHEAADARDRRYGDAGIACPACGPRLRLEDADGRELVSDRPLRAAARALAAGLTVAVKGVGGFELVCDATSSLAVGRLRQRLGRATAPFAVLVRDLERAWQLADLLPGEEDLLLAVERPIVLARRRPSARLAPEVALDNPLLGLLLPCSPLEQLLAGEVEEPLVIAAGHRAAEPLALANAEARAGLRDVADLFLVHDLEIAARSEASVVRWVAGGPLLLRRSRGYVPRALTLPRAVPSPVLGCGAGPHGTFCIAVDDQAICGPHVGGLAGDEASRAAFAEAVTHLERLLGVSVERVAHDADASAGTAYARECGLPCTEVPHALAHAASARAAAGVRGLTLALVWDGAVPTGSRGVAGAAPAPSEQGGALFLLDDRECQPLAELRPLPVVSPRPGGGDGEGAPGDRIAALWALDEAFDGEAPRDRLPALDGVDRAALGRDVPGKSRSAGRLLDVVATLIGCADLRQRQTTSITWLDEVAGRSAAGLREPGRGALPIDRHGDGGGLWQLDWRPLLRALVGDLLRGVPAPTLAARVHAQLARAAVDLIEAAIALYGELPVVLAGECFTSASLCEGVLAAAAGRDLRLPRSVPPGDGGLALGQVVLADVLAPRLAAREVAS